MPTRSLAACLLALTMLVLSAAPALAGRDRFQVNPNPCVQNPCVEPSKGIVPAMPEPGAFALFAIGAALAGWAIRRR